MSERCHGVGNQSKVIQLNALQGAAEELGDLLKHRIGNREIELAYSLWGIDAPDRIVTSFSFSGAY